MDKWLEWLGYIASAVVLISLLMTSLKKLRWINFVGAVMFGTYGFLIASIPTGIMNLGIAVIDIYFIVKMSSSKDFFKLLQVNHENSDYYNEFVEFYQDDMNKFQNVDLLDNSQADIKVFTLRNMNPAGLFVGKKHSNNTLEVLLDYAVPQYRDFKLGDFLFREQKEYFIENGYNKLLAYADKEDHIKYLEKMGFVSEVVEGKLGFVKELKKGE